MANPLAILGSIAAGLTTVGAGGASGLFEGEVGGEHLKRQYASQDLDNQLRVLQMIAQGQQLEQSRLPAADISGNRIINRAYPHGPITGVSELPETATQKATREHAEAGAALQRAQAGNVGVSSDPMHAWQKKFADATAAGDQAGADQAMTILNRLAQIHAGATTPKTRFDKSTDANGNVTYLVGTSDAAGKWTVQQIPLGKIGHAPVGATAGVPRETVTTSTKITPRKEITTDNDLNALRTALPTIVNEIAGSSAISGWMQPGPTVRVQGYAAPVRREDVIAHWVKRKTGVEVSVNWDGKQWRLVKAWIPSSREPIETKRTVGPPREPTVVPGEPEEAE